ncbi:ABC transporter permease/substrate-binding protein [Paenibacillus sp. SC116]|uniref:ABC transporter permease/substrate-binding protein n=1 Tax=Paenibacillus sp. SC116 TaxID=2968986 RepID=UPI00215ADB50|nr:ABC transporter permease/substrate-binding protein [Paenibacillus sp. SC116]MCR8842470.1 ABC transporter permease/substrate-binding protein [Paenibacillus sp. SC116]
MNNLWQTFLDRKADLWSALIEHMTISLISLFFALLIAVPLGIYLTRQKRAAELVIGISAVFQTIPSLALLGLLIPLVGIGTVPAIIALVIYALLPILRNIYTGIIEVDRSLIEAAKGLGMNNRRLLLKVELPLAMPVIMAGVRTAMVLIIGTTTIASLIGAGGLGDLIIVGIDRNDTSLILLGAIPAAVLALLFDFLLKKIEKFSFKKSMISVISVVIAVFLVIFVTLGFQPQKADIVIGGKLGSEPEILMNMYKLLIEENTSLNVELKPNMGGTTFVYNALLSDSIDMYTEFTGTAIVDLLKEQPISTDQKQVYKQAKDGLQSKLNWVMLEPMAYNNTYALAIPSSMAEKYNIGTISDLKAIEHLIAAGFTPEFPEREDGYLGIQKLYGIQFANINIMQPALRYTALNSGDIQLIDAYSTDSEIQQYNLTVLNDDKHLFPPYQGAPLLKADTLTKYPELQGILNKLSNKITDDEMRLMNYKVNVEKKGAASVAKEFLEKNNLLP